MTTERTKLKKQLRAAKEETLAKRTLALPDKKYNVVLADPPWSFKTYSDNGMDRSADNHYPVMNLVEIHDLGERLDCFADDAVLFLWATAPMLPHALGTMWAWGFTYKSHFVWVKDKIGLGYWARNQHELLLIGTRGKIPAPAPGTQLSSVILAPRGEHSAKPDAFYRVIELYFPNLPKIELFHRGKPREGWSAWGSESDAGYSL